jgi:histidine phosphotransferase ChpT
MQVDMRVLELLSSKMCHDLISPVSAINNGVELIEDIGGSVVEEAMKLIGDSAGHASRRLRLFRMAYGRAGSEEGLAARDAKLVSEQYMTGGKVTLNWPDDQPAPQLAARPGFLKVLLNFVLMSEEALAYGGVVTLRGTEEGGEAGCQFEIVGRGAQLAPHIQAALDGTAPISELTPRSIQSYITGKFAAHFNFRVKFDQSVPDKLNLSLMTAEVVAAMPEAALRGNHG